MREVFLEDLENSNLSANSNNSHKNYTNLSQTFSKVVQKHTPLKKKILRGNDAPFINREFREEIYKRSRLRNEFWKDPSKENENLFKTQRNKCVSLRRKNIKSYFQHLTKKDLVTNKSFWNFVKPFLTNNSCHTQNDIMLIDNGKVTVEESDLIVQHYSNHSSILKVRENFENSQTVEQFQFISVTTSEIYKLLKNKDEKKATGTDKISPKLVKISTEVLSQLLVDAINSSISKGVFPDNAKIASVYPTDKQSDNKNKVSNFTAVSVLNTFSKIYESVIKINLFQF